MNDDTISRQAAINTAHLMRSRCDTNDIDDYANMMFAALDVLPSVDPVKHARWISDTGGFYCSNCKHHTDDDEIGNWDITFGKWVYCPHCGAKMDL